MSPILRGWWSDKFGCTYVGRCPSPTFPGRYATLEGRRPALGACFPQPGIIAGSDILALGKCLGVGTGCALSKYYVKSRVAPAAPKTKIRLHRLPTKAGMIVIQFE